MRFADLPNNINDDLDLIQKLEKSIKNDSLCLVAFGHVNGTPVCAIPQVTDFAVFQYEVPNCDYSEPATLCKSSLDCVPKGDLFDFYLSTLEVYPVFVDGELNTNPLIRDVLDDDISDDNNVDETSYIIVSRNGGTHFTYNASTMTYLTIVTNLCVEASSLCMAAYLTFDWEICEADLVENFQSRKCNVGV